MFDLLDEYTVVADGANFSPTAADQLLFSVSIPERRGVKYYLLHCDIAVTTTGTSNTQSLDLEILNDATVVKTFNIGGPASIQKSLTSITHPIAKNTVGTIKLQLGNASADAQTVIKVMNVWVAAVG